MYALRRFAVRRSRQFEWVYQRLESLLVSLDPLLSKLGYARLERPVAAVERVSELWRRAGMTVETMDVAHHDQVLALTSHLPHLIAYTMVGVADDMRRVTQSEVIKYSAAGFRDFTRIAASDPTMWRDVFLTNKLTELPWSPLPCQNLITHKTACSLFTIKITN